MCINPIQRDRNNTQVIYLFVLDQADFTSYFYLTIVKLTQNYITVTLGWHDSSSVLFVCKQTFKALRRLLMVFLKELTFEKNPQPTKKHTKVLIDFWLTVKVATKIFISGCGSAISSAEEGKSGFIYNLVRVNKLFSRANVHAFHEKPDRISLASHVLTLNGCITKRRMFLLSTETFWSLFNKQCRSRSVCSYRSCLIWVHNVCVYTHVKQ